MNDGVKFCPSCGASQDSAGPSGRSRPEARDHAAIGDRIEHVRDKSIKEGQKQGKRGCLISILVLVLIIVIGFIAVSTLYYDDVNDVWKLPFGVILSTLSARGLEDIFAVR
jgi:hypothetical protein